MLQDKVDEDQFSGNSDLRILTVCSPLPEREVLSQDISSVPGREMNYPGFALEFFSDLEASAWGWANFQGNMLLTVLIWSTSKKYCTSGLSSHGMRRAGWLPFRSPQLQPDITVRGMHISLALLRSPWHLWFYWALHCSWSNYKKHSLADGQDL